MILTAAQIRSYYPQGAVFVSDGTFATPTSVWLERVFYPWFWEFRTQLGLRAYSRKNDCDNFARSASSAAQDCHALTNDGASPGEKAEGLAIGEFWYRKTDGEMHAINTGIFDAGVRRFWEPQTGQFLELTPEEIASCTFVYF